MSLNQVRQLLETGLMENYDQNYVLCKEGDKSTDMFILLAGELAIKKGNVELARVQPVEIVGEMGLITGQPRSAMVETAKNTTLLLISKMKFDVALKKDADAAAKIYKNMLNSVCNKLRQANARLTREKPVAGQEFEASMV